MPGGSGCQAVQAASEEQPATSGHDVHLPKYHPTCALTSYREAESCTSLGDKGGSLKAYEGCLSVLKVCYGVDHADVVEVQKRVVDCSE